MLLTELILSKRGPLAKVWLSAHQERKLSKQQTLGVDVEESVGMFIRPSFNMLPFLYRADVVWYRCYLDTRRGSYSFASIWAADAGCDKDILEESAVSIG
jgi:hypothetical protein